MQKGRTGSTIRSDTIGGYVSAIKLATARAQRPPITSADFNLRLPLILKQMRKDQPPGASGNSGRALQHALRARHLRQIADAGYDRTSRRGADVSMDAVHT